MKSATFKFQRERKNLSFLSPSDKTTFLALKVIGEEVKVTPCRDYLRTAFLQRLQAWRMTRLCLMVLRLAPSCLSLRVRPGDLLVLTSLAMDDITQVEDPTRPYSSNSFPLHRKV